MKKLLILTAVLMLAGSAVGCQWCNSWSLGFPRRAAYSAPSYNYSYNCYDPCACTTVSPCRCP
jgi:hypothetical protein